MELSLSKLPWYAQIGAFVLVSAGAWAALVASGATDIPMARISASGVKRIK